MFPNLPSDNIFKVLFFGGAIIIAILVKYAEDINEGLNNNINNYNHKIIGLKHTYSMDSLESTIINKKIEKLNRDTSVASIKEELENEKVLFIKNVLLKKRIKEEMQQMYNEIKRAELDKKNYDNFFPFFLALFAVILLIGFISWIIPQANKEEFETRKNHKEEKNIPCQSCGMILKNDFKPYLEVELCSNCFDGEIYKEPDLTLKEMEKRIEKRMKELGLKEKYIKKHTTELANLNRWNQTLKW